MSDAVRPAFAWNAAGHAIRQGLTIALLMVQARLLSPADFGLLALALVAIGLGDLGAQVGMPAAIIHRRDLDPRHLSSAFWLCAATGVAFTLGLALAAPAIARVFDEPRLAPVLAVSAVNVLIAAISAVPNALRIRDLRFDVVMVQETTALAVAGAVGTLLAWHGFGVWSLVAQTTVATAIACGMSWRMTAWRPSSRFEWRAAGELARVATPTLGTNLVHYASRHVADILVGRFLGAAALGLYSRAFAIMLVPLANVSAVLTRVLFPSLARLGDDRARAAALFLAVMRAAAMLIFPMMLGLFVTVDAFVLTVFGPKWTELIPLLRILVLVGMLQSIAALAGSLFLSQGRTDVHLRLSLVLAANVVVAVVIGLRWGMLGVAAGYAAAATLNVVPVLWVGGRLVGLSLATMARALAPTLAVSLAMAALVWALGLAVPVGWPAPTRLALQVGVGVTTYVALLAAVQPSALREAWQWLAAAASGRAGADAARQV